MKKILLITLAVMISMAASSKDLNKDITMVSYEQSWSDFEASLSLKNNTDEEIRNITFIITYLDMDDNEIDYEEFQKSVSIAPGMTKKVKIDAYEHNRDYYYYESEGSNSDTPFKIKFQLKDYNDESMGFGGMQDNNTSLYLILTIVFIVLAISICIGLYVLVAVMAQKRNRNVVLWVLLSLLATPLLMIIILLFIGKEEKNTYEQNYNK